MTLQQFRALPKAIRSKLLDYQNVLLFAKSPVEHSLEEYQLGELRLVIHFNEHNGTIKQVVVKNALKDGASSIYREPSAA